MGLQYCFNISFSKVCFSALNFIIIHTNYTYKRHHVYMQCTWSELTAVTPSAYKHPLILSTHTGTLEVLCHCLQTHVHKHFLYQPGGISQVASSQHEWHVYHNSHMHYDAKHIHSCHPMAYSHTPINTKQTPRYTWGLPSLATDTGAYTLIWHCFTLHKRYIALIINNTLK